MLIVPMLDQGGLERVCAETAQLLKTDYDVHLVVFNTAGMIYDVSGVDLVDLGLGAVNGRIGKLLNVLKRTWCVKKLKKQLGTQLSYSFGSTANLVNVLSRHRDVIWVGIRGYGALGSKYTMKLVCSLADRVVGCTRVMEQEIVRRYHPRRTSTLYNPCDIEQIRKLSALGTPPEFDGFFARDGKTVVSMGREHDVKGFWHLIKAVSLVRREGIGVKLMIMGAGHYQEYRELASALGMGEDILFTGVQSNPFALLRRADVYALTSESEGFPNALIEAMACGIPCISVNCMTGPAEILQEDYTACGNQHRVYYADYGILAPVFQGAKNLEPDSVTAEEEIFARELIRLLTEDCLYRHYKEMAARRAGMFGPRVYLEKLVAMMEEGGQTVDQQG